MTTNNAIRDALIVSSRRAFLSAARERRPQYGLTSRLSERHRALRQTLISSPRHQYHASFHSTSQSSSATSIEKGSLLNQPPQVSLSAPQAQLFYTSRTHRLNQLPSLRSTSSSGISFFRSRIQFLHSRRWRSTSTRGKAELAASSSSKSAGKASSKASPNEYGYILNKLPDLSPRFHRPSKEELLAAATGFWSRLRVRFKWFSIRSLRPFNIDDISAFVTWTLAGHLIWIVVGTTTFFSLIIFAVNTVFAQETLAGWVGNYLTQSSGLKVVFESAIVPRWKDGVITFKNVFVSRRPGQGKSDVRKGSSTTAIADKLELDKQEDINYTQFDVSIETVNVTLSFTKWFNGHGPLKDVEIKGIRGVVDRTNVVYPESYIDPRTYKHPHNTGDFEIESFKMEDLLLSVHQPGGVDPFSVSVFSADLPQLRKQWLFYDLLSANHMSGSIDSSAFFIHPRQLHNLTAATIPDDPRTWKKQSRVRVDALNIAHLNRGVAGPFSWIAGANVDIAADIMFPADDDESLSRIVAEFYDKLEESVARGALAPPSRPDARPTPATAEGVAEPGRYLVMDVRLQLNDVHATVPLFSPDLSYVNSALIRPIVAYINSHRSFIPLNCRVVKEAGEFNGSWTVYDSGLMEDLSCEAYQAFERDVVDEQSRVRRMKKVGWWSLQLAVQALLLGLAGNVA